MLVIGGNEEAADKAQRLLDAGAKVTVISPTLHGARKLAASAKIIHRGRHFRANDLESVISRPEYLAGRSRTRTH